MARLPYLGPEDVAERHRPLLDRNINLYKALVNSPEMTTHFGGLGGYFRHESNLDPRLRELAILQVGYLARAPYEWSHHIKLAREDFGVTTEDIRALIADTNGGAHDLGELDRMVLRLAREMTMQVGGSEEAFAHVVGALGDEHALDLVGVIAFYNMVVRVLETVAIDVEDDYIGYLEEFPLPS